MTALDLARARVAQLEREQAQQQAACRHQWSAVTYAPDVTPGYYENDYHAWRVEGQAPRQVWVSEKTTPRWRRTCTVCGKVETTTTMRQTVQTTTTPDFGDGR